MRAKERLTGAIILVALIVLIVPELLTGPQHAETPASGMAGEGAPMRSYTIELGERSTSRPAQPLATRTPHETASSEAAPGPAPAEPSPAPNARTQAPKVVEPAPAQAAAVPPRASTPEPKARTDSVPESGWSVQVGSFASRENAERLMGELRSLGYRCFVTEGTGGARKLYRVRIGPTADRDAVEALAERVRTDDRLARDLRNGSIVPHP